MPDYWLNLFSGKTWQEFLDHGAEVTGFRDTRWSTVKQLKPGDILLCYLTGVSRWVGALRVVSEPYQDDSEIWEDEEFPCRVRVEVVVSLTPETAVPVHNLSDQLSMFQNQKSPNAWTGRFRGSPTKWRASDGQVVLQALHEAMRNPVVRPVDPKRLGRRPKALRSPVGPVVVPDDEQTEPEDTIQVTPEITAHTEIQWLLLNLGNGLGLDTWVARNDRSKSFKGTLFSELPRSRATLPRQFDEVTSRTIELIDVLWLSGNSIIAAFEVESTTSIYSGLLRMSDLISMQPNLNIPLYLVAPDERREKVIAEVNRPTFSRLSPPLKEICRFISFSALRDRIEEISPWVQYMKPDLLLELSESCEADEA